jgi:hypothetical protein
MANIIIKGGHDKFGKTRSEHEENMRKEWGHTMNDEQLDKLKFMERKTKDANGSKKNFATGIEIDQVDRVGRRDKMNEIISSPASNKYRAGYAKIKWDTKIGWGVKSPAVTVELKP